MLAVTKPYGCVILNPVLFTMSVDEEEKELTNVSTLCLARSSSEALLYHTVSQGLC